MLDMRPHRANVYVAAVAEYAKAVETVFKGLGWSMHYAPPTWPTLTVADVPPHSTAVYSEDYWLDQVPSHYREYHCTPERFVFRDSHLQDCYKAAVSPVPDDRKLYVWGNFPPGCGWATLPTLLGLALTDEQQLFTNRPGVFA